MRDIICSNWNPACEHGEYRQTWTQNQKRPADRMAEPAMGDSLGFPHTQPKRVFRLQDPTLGSVLIFEV